MNYGDSLHTALMLLAEEAELEHTEPTRDRLVERLTALLATDPERLMQILYRIDVSEERVNAIFRAAPLDRIAEQLADAILERMALKAQLRAQYAHSSRVVHVHIRPYRLEDAPQLAEAVAESRAALAQWLPWCTADYTLEHARAWCEHAATLAQSGQAYHFAVEAIVDGTPAFAGGCGLTPTHDRSSRVAALGYWTRTSLCCRGIATAAARQLLDLAFGTLGFERVEILIATSNYASQRVAEKLGAHREGLLRSRIAVGSQRYDAYLYSILRTQWRSASAEAATV